MNYAVAIINFFIRELKIEFIEAATWKDALSKHSSMLLDISLLSDEIEEAKREAFDADFLFDVKELE